LLGRRKKHPSTSFVLEAKTAPTSVLTQHQIALCNTVYERFRPRTQE
jgi:hypothetical protein